MTTFALDYARKKLLEGDFEKAALYYQRAIEDGVEPCIVNLRYLTKEYLVYPLEYENSVQYFELIGELKKLSSKNPDYLDEYKLAVQSLADIRRLFMRALSLFYFSDILVSSSDSVVLHEITEIQKYIKTHKEDLLENDIFGLKENVSKFNKKQFAKDLNIIEAYCMNILLSYTAEQHSVYQGKRYSATTVDYGYFYSTTVRETDSYYNYANIKPRMFLLGYETYYFDLLKVYEEKLNEIGRFDSPKELRKELTAYVDHKNKKDKSAKMFLEYAKHFERNDSSRQSWYGSLLKLGKTLNPLLKIMSKINPFESSFMTNNVGSFELDVYFPQKKIWGVCSMLAAGKGWKVDTVRAMMCLATAVMIGPFVYFALAIAMKLGFYFGVNIDKP